jgi:hypothetical protein
MPEHVALLESIKDALRIPPGGTGYVIKFRHLKPAIASDVAPLLQQLPATVGRNAALNDLRNFTPQADRWQVTNADVKGGGRGRDTTYQPSDRPRDFDEAMTADVN